MVEKLTKIWRSCQTFELAMIFEGYMQDIGAKKADGRRKNNNNTYIVDGKSTSWNRVECYYNKDSIRYGEENLLLVLRKDAGDYLIIQRKNKRAFEVDHNGVSQFDENLLKEITDEHKPLFDALIKQFCPKTECVG